MSTDHQHRAGQPCPLPGCGDPQPRVAAAVDALLRDVDPGRTVARSFIAEALVFEYDTGSRGRGQASREMYRLKQKKGSSRGSRLTPKIAHRLRVLEEAGAVIRVGTTHVQVVDMGLAPLLLGGDRDD